MGEKMGGKKIAKPKSDNRPKKNKKKNKYIFCNDVKQEEKVSHFVKFSTQILPVWRVAPHTACKE